MRARRSGLRTAPLPAARVDDSRVTLAASTPPHPTPRSLARFSALTGALDRNWQGQWVFDAFWESMYFLIMAAIAVLWRPTENSLRYAYMSQLAADETEAEAHEEGGEAYMGDVEREEQDIEVRRRARARARAQAPALRAQHPRLPRDRRPRWRRRRRRPPRPRAPAPARSRTSRSGSRR